MFGKKKLGRKGLERSEEAKKIRVVWTLQVRDRAITSGKDADGWPRADDVIRKYAEEEEVGSRTNNIFRTPVRNRQGMPTRLE